MPSVQRILSRHNAHAATLAASSVRASTAIERVGAQRAGGGRVLLAGSYTGHEAAAVDIKVVATGGIPRASAPQFVGVGNGQLTVDAVDGAAPLQAITFTLADLGLETQTAGLDLREVRIVAKAAGSAGNSIRLSVTPALTQTPASKALLQDWPAGQETQTGEQWDFGALPLSPKGELDASSPRLQFGSDPQVYRPWRKFAQGAWQFGLSPALQRSLAKGTPVFTVTGSYSVTVADGVAPDETYAGVVTFHDLLTQLAASSLVQVAGVVAADRTTGGQAAIDVPLRTSAWLLATGGAVALDAIGIPADAPTQSVTVRCVNNDVVGSERWEVAADVSGALAFARTGEPYFSAAANFVIPAKELPANSGDWNHRFDPAERGDMEGLPAICIRPFKLGRNASAKRVSFVYTKRPPNGCDCKNLPAPPVSDRCLGLNPDGGDMALDPAYQTRLEALYKWRGDFVQANVALQKNYDFGFAYIRADAREIEMVDAATNELARCLAEIYESSPARAQWDVELARLMALMLPHEALDNLPPPAATAMQWTADTAYNVGTVIYPPVRNGRLYTVTTGGESDSTEPDWDAPPPVEDLDVRYSVATYWSASTAVAKDTIIESGNGYKYIATAGGITGTAEPDWDDTPPLTDGTVTWAKAQQVGAQIHLSGDVVINQYSSGSGLIAISVVTRAGRRQTIYASPYNPEEEAASRRDVAHANAEPSIAAFTQRFATRMDYVRTLAGIVPKSESSSTDAGGCWIDYPEDAYWWVDPTGTYLPAFTNRAYISARIGAETGKPMSTQEFGFGLVVGCPERLKKGDTLTIDILQVDAQKPYKVGDEATLQTVAGGAAWLTGGVDGTDELTWRVSGSVSGALLDYVVPTDGTPAPAYTQAGLDARIALGGIPFVLGDQFSLAVEAGQYQWRRDGGAWSAAADIPLDGLATLADGLQAQFVPGAAPSFVPDDAYAYQVHQPWAASHVQDASATQWGWAGAAASMVLDLGSVRAIACIALARYQLPAGAAVGYQLSDDASAWTAPAALDVTGPVCVTFPAAAAARYIKISVAGAPDGAIGWIYAGTPFATQYSASRATRTHRWAMARGNGGINPAALFAGQGDGWALEWAEDSLLFDADIAALLPLLDAAQQRDEPILFVPHHLHPQDASLVRVGDDALQVGDVHEYQPNNRAQRLLSASLALEPVYA